MKFTAREHSLAFSPYLSVLLLLPHAKCSGGCCVGLVARARGGENVVDVKQDSNLGVSNWRWEESSDAMCTYGIFASILVFGATPFASSLRYGELLYFVGLAATTIYIGAHRSLGAKARQQISFKEVWDCSKS